MKRCSYDKLRYRLMRTVIRVLELFTKGKKLMTLRRWFVDYYFSHEEI